MAKAGEVAVTSFSMEFVLADALTKLLSKEKKTAREEFPERET